MDHAALAWSRRKESGNSSQQAIMPIRDDQIPLGGSARAQILQQVHPAIFAFFCTRT
jgi:hypothetical protein